MKKLSTNSYWYWFTCFGIIYYAVTKIFFILPAAILLGFFLDYITKKYKESSK